MANSLEEMIAIAGQAKILDADLFAQAIGTMQVAFPDEDFSVAASLIDHQPTEAVLHLVDEHLPDWTITLHGKAHESDGEWKCTLRKSSSRDDDAIIGIGAGPRLGLAVLVAVLKASVLRAKA